MFNIENTTLYQMINHFDFSEHPISDLRLFSKEAEKERGDKIISLFAPFDAQSFQSKLTIHTGKFNQAL